MTIYIHIGRSVRLARKAARLTQEGLGVAVGLSRVSISNLEAGRQRVSLEHLVLLAEALSVDLVDLLPGRRRSGRCMRCAETAVQLRNMAEAL